MAGLMSIRDTNSDVSEATFIVYIYLYKFVDYIDFYIFFKDFTYTLYRNLFSIQQEQS